VIGYRDIADTDKMIDAAAEIQARGGDRRRPARPGSRQRPEAARHGCHRGTHFRLAAGAPAGPHRRQAAAEESGSKGLNFLLQKHTAELVGDGDGRVKPRSSSRMASVNPADLVVMAAGIRPNAELAESCGIARATAASSSTTPCRPTTRASTLSANAPTTVALPTAWWRRCSSRPRSVPTIWPSYGIARYQGSVTSTKLKVTGIDLFSAGDFTGGDGTEDHHCSPTRSAASTRSW
jgi:nitrite reductase (NADH) large subunit